MGAGRPSKLTEAQWAELLKKHLRGKSVGDLAREYKISAGSIRRKINIEGTNIKLVAGQVLAADCAMKQLPIYAQDVAAQLIDDVRAISASLSSAARYNAATANDMARRVLAQTARVNDDDPMESQEVLQGIAALLKIGNEAAATPLAVLAANKEVLKRATEPPPDLPAMDQVTDPAQAADAYKKIMDGA